MKHNPDLTFEENIYLRLKAVMQSLDDERNKIAVRGVRGEAGWEQEAAALGSEVTHIEFIFGLDMLRPRTGDAYVRLVDRFDRLRLLADAVLCTYNPTRQPFYERVIELPGSVSLAALETGSGVGLSAARESQVSAES